MSAFLKVYTDSGHTSEVAHTTNVGTTINNVGGYAAGVTQIVLTSVTGMPAQGYIDIIDGTNGNETIQYTLISGNTLTLATATAFTHPNSCVVNQWYYLLAVGDQTNGILADGSNAAPNSPTNVGTWYVYNAGNQVAQSITIATSSGGSSTTSGFADTLISITSVSSGYAASVSPSNLNAGSQQQIWVVAEIPNGQSPVGNPQICVINITFQSI